MTAIGCKFCHAEPDALRHRLGCPDGDGPVLGDRVRVTGPGFAGLSGQVTGFGIGRVLVTVELLLEARDLEVIR